MKILSGPRNTVLVVSILGCTTFLSSTDAALADMSLGPGFEPTIAVNPLDPQNIAMARLTNARVSTDGGTTWSVETAAVVPAGYGDWPVPTPPMPPGIDASLAFDSQGRLFWAYQADHETGDFDLFVCELNPSTGAMVAGPFQVTADGVLGYGNDKAWLAADTNPESDFHDRLYLGWTRFPLSGRIPVMSSYSTDHGQTWSAPLQVSIWSQAVAFGAHLAIPPNGDVYLAYQMQHYTHGCNGSGLTGRIWVARSTDGGETFSQNGLALSQGQAEVSFNQQNCMWTIPGATFWNYTEPWIMADPNADGLLYVVAADDPDSLSGGDAGDVVVVRSEDHGVTWSSPARVDDGPGETIQFLPTASIDPVSGRVVVAWFDNRSGLVNADSSYLLEYRCAISVDSARTFSRSFLLSDVPFDPDDGVWFQRHTSPPPATNWIGEYFGIALSTNTVYAVWTGNGATGQPQETIFDRFELPPVSVPILAEPAAATMFIRPSHPEPFTSQTAIEYRIARPGLVRMSVYDVAGREVANLVNSVQESGLHSVTWDGRGDDGEASPAGVYFMQLRTDGDELTEKVVLVR